MSLRDKEGNRLFRRVEVTVYFPEHIFPPKKFVQRAGGKAAGDRHRGFGPEAIDKMLMDLAEELEQLYPWWEFKLVEKASSGHTAYYVFDFAGYHAKESSHPKEEAAEAVGPFIQGAGYRQPLASESSAAAQVLKDGLGK